MWRLLAPAEDEALRYGHSALLNFTEMARHRSADADALRLRARRQGTVLPTRGCKGTELVGSDAKNCSCASSFAAVNTWVGPTTSSFWTSGNTSISIDLSDIFSSYTNFGGICGFIVFIARRYGNTLILSSSTHKEARHVLQIPAHSRISRI